MTCAAQDCVTRSTDGFARLVLQPGSAATLVLPAALVEFLRDHQEQQAKIRASARAWVDSDLVFATRIGTAIEPRNLSRSWDKVRTRAGQPGVTIHGLRHLAASLSFAAGSSVKEVQEQLRHSRQSTTADVYVSVLQSVKRGTAERMDGVFRKLAGHGDRG